MTSKDEWIRQCQECGWNQHDREPTATMTQRAWIQYDNRICRKCKSPGLDHGSMKPSTALGITEGWSTTQQQVAFNKWLRYTYLGSVNKPATMLHIKQLIAYPQQYDHAVKMYDLLGKD